MFITHGKNIKSANNNNKFKIYVQTLNENFDLLNGSYSLSDIEDYMKLLKHMKLQQILLRCKFIPKNKKQDCF